MVLASLMDFLKANGVRPIAPRSGEQFDPNRHEAVDQVPHATRIRPIRWSMSSIAAT